MDEPWKEQDDLDLDWRFPRSFAEVRERWKHDSGVRLLVALVVVIAISMVLVCFQHFGKPP